jgi:glycosyltransferase involved in cell wall biosynthesis
VCGVPVVAFDTGETRAVVRDRETGRVVPDGDITALADAIASLLDDEDGRRALSAGARSFARATFTSWEDRVAREIDVLDSLIGT